MTLVPNKTTESRVSLWLLHTIFFSIFLTFHRAVSFFCCVIMHVRFGPMLSHGCGHKRIIIKFWRPHSGAPNGPPIGYSIGRPFCVGERCQFRSKYRGSHHIPMCQMCVVQKEIDTCWNPVVEASKHSAEKVKHASVYMARLYMGTIL